MKKSNKKYIIVALIVLLLALAVGYAAFGDTLTITGSANAKGTFDLEFVQAETTVDAVSVGVDLTEGTGTRATVSADKNTLDVYVVNLAYPGAGAQFTTQIKNVGTVDAKLTDVTVVGNDDTDIVVTFPTLAEDGSEVIKANGGTCDLTFTVEWDAESELKTEKTLDFSLELVYEQATTAFTGSEAHTAHTSN